MFPIPKCRGESDKVRKSQIRSCTQFRYWQNKCGCTVPIIVEKSCWPQNLSEVGLRAGSFTVTSCMRCQLSVRVSGVAASSTKITKNNIRLDKERKKPKKGITRDFQMTLFHTSFHTRGPPLPPLAKERSTVGRALAQHRLTPRWLYPQIYSLVGLVCVFLVTPYMWHGISVTLWQSLVQLCLLATRSFASTGNDTHLAPCMWVGL